MLTLRLHSPPRLIRHTTTNLGFSFRSSRHCAAPTSQICVKLSIDTSTPKQRNTRRLKTAEKEESPSSSCDCALLFVTWRQQQQARRNQKMLQQKLRLNNHPNHPHRLFQSCLSSAAESATQSK